jgi:proline iminopeptidase
LIDVYCKPPRRPLAVKAAARDTRDMEDARFLNVEGARLWTSTSGTNGIGAVLCHGGPGLSDNLMPLAKMIDDLAVVHRYDQRGGGRSSAEEPYSVDRFTDDLDALRRIWGYDDWVVGGHSWGGWLSLLYASKHPGRVRAVVAIDMPPFDRSWRAGYRSRRQQRMSPVDRKLFARVESLHQDGKAVDPREEEQWRHALWRSDFANPEAAPNFIDAPLYLFPANHDVNRALVADLDERAAHDDVLKQFQSLTMPVFFMHGQQDLRPPPHDVVQALPTSELSIIPGAGHLPWLERPDEVEHQLRAWIKSLV